MMETGTTMQLIVKKISVMDNIPLITDFRNVYF
jgi:hypothetical protein